MFKLYMIWILVYNPPYNIESRIHYIDWDNYKECVEISDYLNNTTGKEALIINKQFTSHCEYRLEND